MIDNNGTQVYPTVIDRYGNFLSQDASGNVIDDTGRTPVIVTVNGNDTYYDVLASGGPSGSSHRLRYTVTTALIPIKTAFQESDIYEWEAPYQGGPMLLKPIQSITLPDSSKYSFVYDIYGGMTSVTLPTGGVVQYGYTNFKDSAKTPNRWLTSRQLGNDPQMAFTPAVITTCVDYTSGCKEQVTVHKPSGDETVYTLTLNNGAWKTASTTYTGAASAGIALLSTEDSNTYSNPCTGANCSGANQIVSSLTTTTLWDQGSKMYTQNQSVFDPKLGKPTSEKQWNYLTGTPASTTQAPNTIPVTETRYIYSGRDLSQAQVLNSLGNPTAQTTYTYTSTAVATTGIAGHGTQNAGGPYLQSVSKFLNTNYSAPPTTTYSTDDTGMVQTVQDANGNTTAMSYQCSNSLPFETTNAAHQSTRSTYDCDSAALSSVQDPNDLAAARSGTLYTYEPVAGRLQSVTSVDGGVVTNTYPQPTEVDTSTAIPTDATVTTKTISDSFGRAMSKIIGTTQVDQTYDANGRGNCSTNPYSVGGNSTGSTCISKYDGLDRPRTQTNTDGSTRTWSYSLNQSTTTDEAGVSKTQILDARGKITAVSEAGSSVSYSYDVLGNLNSISESGSAQRTFTYDSLSRLVCEAHAESGKGCPPSAYSGLPSTATVLTYYPGGQIQTKTDARGQIVSYTYDSLNRLSGKSFGTTQGTGTTQVAGFLYDGATPAGGVPSQATTGAAANQIGRPSYAWTAASIGPGKDEQYLAYDSMGRLNQLLQRSPSDGNSIHSVAATYNQAGELSSLTYPDGKLRQFHYDASGRPSTVGEGSATQTYVQSVDYNLDGSPHVLKLGNGVQQTMEENDRLQVQSLRVDTVLPPLSNHPFLSHTYCYVNCPSGGSQNNGLIRGIADGLNASRTQDFTYDALNRINAFSLGGTLNQQYSIDQAGNLSGVVGGQPTTTFDSATNRITNLPCAPSYPQPYDAAGNQLCDSDSTTNSVWSYAYNAEERMMSATALNSGTPFEIDSYDASGARSRKENPGSGEFTEYTYFGGQIIATKDQTGAWTDYIYAGGSRIARVEPSSVRAHLSGNRIDPAQTSQVWDAYILPLPSTYQVKQGDILSFRMYQHNANAALSLGFTDGTNSDNFCGVDQYGNCLHGQAQADSWLNRQVDLGKIAAGKTMYYMFLEDAYGPAGTFDVLVADMTVTSADGTITTLVGAGTISTAPSNSGSCNPVNAATAWPIRCATERVTDANDFAGPPSQTRFLFSDHLGSTAMEFSAGGWPVASTSFAPYGQELSPQGLSGPYKYTGLERDQSTGLDHAMFRQYTSNLGRWTSPDPYDGSMDLSDPQSLNRYNYVGNMPMMYRDPSGKAIGCVTSHVFGLDGNEAVGSGGGECTGWGDIEEIFRNIGSFFGLHQHHLVASSKSRPPAPSNGTPIPTDQVQKCAQQGAAAAAPYNSAAAKAMPSNMKMAGTAVLVGAGAGIARARGTPWWAVVSGAILGAASPFAESAANYATGVAVQSATFQGCMAAAGVVPPTF